MKQDPVYKSGYSEVNGLQLYYEIHGNGKPLVLIHGGGSTIQTSFGTILPALAEHRQVIAVELQAHGHTNDRETFLSFEQDADDVIRLLKNLEITKADFLGFSNGGHTGIEIALRHAGMVNKMILASTFYKRSGVSPEFWVGFDHACLSDMPEALKEGFLAANNNPSLLLNMFTKDVQRMSSFKDWTDEQIRSIASPVLIINSTNDVGTPEHAVEMYRLFTNAELAIFPGGHGTYLGTIESLDGAGWPRFNAIALIEEFLDWP